ncbi:c-type cytochrome [Cnuella takakiae]|nr:cytochrome c [Cnuella takakiae]
MNSKAASAIVLFLVVLASCAVRKSEPVKGTYFQPKNSTVARGEQLYMIHCQKCHPGGEAGLGPAINANPAPQFLKRFQVRHGLGVMPSFKPEEISRADLHAISKYMKQWKHY